jgi:hypothetical protein
VLECQLRLVVNQAAGHHQVAGHPLRALGLEGLDLVLRGAVQFLAGDVLVDFGRAFAVRPVGAAEVRGVGYPGRSFLLAVAAEAPGAGSATAGVTAGLAAVEGSGCPVLTVPEWPAVLAAATKPAAVTLTLTARTVTKRLPVTITKRLAITITKRLAITVAAATKPATVTLTITARTIPKRLPVTVTKRLTVTISAATKTAAITFTLTARTIPKRLTVTITKLAALTVTVSTAFAVALAAGTIPKRLTVTVAIRLPFTAAGGTAATGEVVAVAVVTGPEAAGLTAGVVVAAERAAVIAAIATVVLGHMESSCCEPTTGATAAARFVSYATRNQALRSPYIFINSSGATKISRTVKALAAGSWPSSQPRPITSCRFPEDAGSVPAAFSGVGGGDI